MLAEVGLGAVQIRVQVRLDRAYSNRGVHLDKLRVDLDRVQLDLDRAQADLDRVQVGLDRAQVDSDKAQGQVEDLVGLDKSQEDLGAGF